ncbi:MAG: two-component regulator propeller domain-containing protein [Planctomycetota bacterium]
MCWRRTALSAAGMLAATVAFAAPPQWNIIKPSTTGVPGEEVRLMAFDPAGNLWIAGRWAFWGEAALAMLPAAELPHTPLPGGGFDTGLWHVWSNVHHPIPSPYLMDMEFAANDIIWLASDGGLTRFDRHATSPEQMWLTYNAANSPLILDEVRSIDLDSQGNIWLTNMSVRLSEGALFKFNPATNEWTEYRVGRELPWAPPWYNVNHVLVGADDHVWLTHSVLGGLAEFDGARWVLHENPHQLGGMLEDLQGNIWIKSSQSGLWKWNGASFDNFDLGSQGTVTALGMYPVSGLVYAGAWYGDIYKLVNGNTPVYYLNADNIPANVYPRPDGELWINNYGGNGTLGTVRHYDAQGALLERFNSFNSGLPWYFVDRIQSDRSGNMWFATGEGGLSRMLGNDGGTPTRWRNWGNHNDGSEPYPFAGNEPMDAMLEDRDGNIWMGGNGVARWDPNTGVFTGFWNWQNSSFGVMICSGLAQTADGTLWAGEKYVGVWHFDPQRNDWVLHTWAPPGWTANDVRDITTDAAGTLWVLTYVQLHRWNANGTWSTWDSTNSPMTLGSLHDIEPDRTRGVWLGMEGKLLHFDGATWTTITQAQAGWPGTNVTGVAMRRSDGKLAVTTQQPSTWPYTGGISLRESNGVWTHYTTANSPLTHWQVSAPHFDARGNLWASAMSEGVVQLILEPPLRPGDLNCDGLVTFEDISPFVLALSDPAGYAAAFPNCNILNGDVNGDGRTNFEDITPFVALLSGPR